MVDLESHIKRIREELDADSPPEGHEGRFLMKLDRRPVRRISFRHGLQIAASVAIILASGIVLIQKNKSGNKVAMKELHISVMEADSYYASQANQRYDQIRQFDFENEEEKVVLLEELNELDAYHQQLLSDLEANPGDERVINALIRHYQLKLEVMDQIIYQLNQYKTETKQSEDEKTHV